MKIATVFQKVNFAVIRVKKTIGQGQSIFHSRVAAVPPAERNKCPRGVNAFRRVVTP